MADNPENPVTAIERDTDPDVWPYVKTIIERIALLWDHDASIRSMLAQRDGAVAIAERVRSLVKEWQLEKHGEQLWLHLSNFYRAGDRPHEALTVLHAYYDYLLRVQQTQARRIHKGSPLVSIGQCYHDLRFPALAKRYLMLALMEDVIQSDGKEIDLRRNGCYFRLVWHLGLPHEEFARYIDEARKQQEVYEKAGWFPEALLLELDAEWMTEAPSPEELYKCPVTLAYVDHLRQSIGDTNGLAWEKLGRYLLWCMPGCRAYGRTDSRSTDYDIVCSVDGTSVDFRSEFGRYFICECKTRKDKDGDKTGFSEVAKFCRVLDSVKAKFGILFARTGISGTDNDRWAAQEITKVYQDRGIVLVVIDENDIAAVANGANFVTLLRRKYETVRLDSMVAQK